MSTNAISYEDYKKLLAAGQKYVAQQQAADPDWQAWQQRAAATSVENMGELPPSPTKDYWSQYSPWPTQISDLSHPYRGPQGRIVLD